MKVLLLGANGQIGHAVQQLARSSHWPKDWNLIAWGREAGDLSQPIELIRHLEKTQPDLIWNAAAYTQVDRAEIEREIAYQINGSTVGEIAKYCVRANIPLIHYSTDYVYRGDGDQPHLESETPDPQNEYGKSKLLGDLAIRASGCEHLIFRTSWVFSEHGKNFVKTMLKLSGEKSSLNVVNDQIGSPTYAADLALNSLQAIQKSLAMKAAGSFFPSGVYHLSNSSETTWYNFAKAIVPQFEFLPIASSEFPVAAKRPLNSRLDLNKFKKTFNASPRPWIDALQECLSILNSK